MVSGLGVSAQVGQEDSQAGVWVGKLRVQPDRLLQGRDGSLGLTTLTANMIIGEFGKTRLTSSQEITQSILQTPLEK